MSKIQAAIQSAKKLRQEPSGDSADAIEGPKRAANVDDADTGSRISVDTLKHIGIDWEVLESNRILTLDNKQRHPVQGAYRMLRTRLMQSMRTNQWRVLGVSSIGENEGKTFTAINLAITIAAEFGQEAVLVDLDLQKPSIYEYIGVDAEDVTGLQEYLESDTTELSELCVNPGIDRLGMLLSSEPLARSSDVLASARGVQLFSELRATFLQNTMIIVDLPPLLAADDALAVAPMIDALLLVVAEGQAERRDVKEVRYMLESFNVIGTVLNKSVEKDSKRTSYYY